MSEFEIVSAAAVPDRYWRFPEIIQLEVGQAIFVPDSEIYTSDDPAHLMRNHAYFKGRRLGRRFRTRRATHKARIGTFVIRVE